jgi:Asp-tRNA(Asn)/Glu-tRNA(Gln) amidotransferase A subunit family amidase
LRIEVIGVEPPCKKCTALLENTKKALRELGYDIEVVKLDVLSDEVSERYGVVMTPALAVDGFIISEGVVLSQQQIASILKGMIK